MQRILIRHLNGARANQIDEIPAGLGAEILVGRDTQAAVRFDASRDDLVSRQHVKITADGRDPNTYTIVDLQSRNGSFLNRQRIYGSALLSHNDVVQLGPGGPEFRFEIDPPPMTSAGAPPVRQAQVLLPPTREVLALPNSDHGIVPRPIGRATVERILGDTFSKVKRESNKAVLVGAAAFAAILVVGGGSFFYMRRNAAENAAQTQQSQQLIKSLDQAVKKAPEATEAMRQEMIRGQKELKTSIVRSEKNLTTLENELARQKIESQRRAQLEEAREADAQAAQQAYFNRRVQEGQESLGRGDTDYVMQVANDLLNRAPNRWEGYALAGAVMKARGKLAEANVYFDRARNLAPPDKKSEVERIQQMPAPGPGQ